MPRKFGVALVFVVVLLVATGLYKLTLKSYKSTSTSTLSNGGLPTQAYGEVVYNGKRDKKLVALTFDADMTYGMEKKLKSGIIKTYYNKKVIDILEKEKVPATLFITGLWVKNYPEVTKSLFENPLFEIGNHSYSHPGFTSKCYTLQFAQDKEREFRDSQEILTKTTGKTPLLFRFPGGCLNKSDLTLAKKFNLTVVGWDVDSGDAFNKNKSQIVRNIENRVQNGSIVVMHMHDGGNAPETGDALPEVISFLKGQGYEFVKASELIQGLTLQ